MLSLVGSYRRRLVIAGVMMCVLSMMTGCHCCKRTVWKPPRVLNPRVSNFNCVDDCSDPTRSMAESEYGLAVELENCQDVRCIDHYYQAAVLAWADMERGLASSSPQDRSAGIYKSSLRQLITAGQRMQRFDPSRGLLVNTPSGTRFVPTTYHGFPWTPDMFRKMECVGSYRSKDLNNAYCCAGIGVATIVSHPARPDAFLKDGQSFAATVVLKPTAGPASAECDFAIELFDPLREETVEIAGRNVPLRRDITAPIVHSFKDVRRNYLNAFLQPGQSQSETGLFMIEPYQPGKIPVVLVHGLLSDPLTWGNIANEIRARPDLRERYQIWGFEYATGEPFLRSAAVLRSHLQRVQMLAEAQGLQPNLRQTVLVGHSMGGIVSKLQVTHSGHCVWNSFSTQPFESIIAAPQLKQQLARSAFFEPSPIVSRVIYVGSPHRGSPWARRSIGRWGASLVEEPTGLQWEHQQLLRDNPHAFRSEFTRRIPTSIDLLRPDSPLLLAIDRLPVSGRVREHSIIGRFRPMIGAGPSDGIVPVASAHRPSAISEKVIHARHGSIHQSPAGIEEILRILQQHMIESQSHAGDLAGSF